MTNSINYPNSSIPAYSGITINISNPTLNAAPLNQCCPESVQTNYPKQPEMLVEPQTPPMDNRMTYPKEYYTANLMTQPNKETVQPIVNPSTNTSEENSLTNTNNAQSDINKNAQAYPPQYYLNNYNYIQNGEKYNKQNASNPISREVPIINNQPPVNKIEDTPEEEPDLSSSQEIINDLDAIAQSQKDLEKNGKQTRVVALTNEYIMSLENYLNNPNQEIRLMASKEILTRLDEDKNRYDDAALNALLNKMLQDPSKLIRMAALSAFASQLASGNDYTVKLLTDIQNNPNSDKDDVVQAADCLLKMSASTEIKYTAQQNNLAPQQEQQQVEE